MNKEKYERTGLEIIRFQIEDVILKSGPIQPTNPNSEDDETELLP